MTTRLASAVDHLRIARRHIAEHAEWDVAPRFDPKRRWYHRLHADDEHEVWLLTWLPGQGTDLHDHGGSRGGFVVMSGRLTEYLPAPTGPDGRFGLAGGELVAGAGRRFGPRHVHRVVNLAARPAVSVHVYSPALVTMNRYRVTATGLSLEGSDKAGAQW